MVNLLEEFLTRARILLTDMKCQDFSRGLIYIYINTNVSAPFAYSQDQNSSISTSS
jgi:hypothetical protein